MICAQVLFERSLYSHRGGHSVGASRPERARNDLVQEQVTKKELPILPNLREMKSVAQMTKY